MTEGLNFTEDHPDPQRLTEEAIRREAPQLVADRGAQNARDIWFEGLGGPVG
jgi:predicted Zn-dependent protease